MRCFSPLVISVVVLSLSLPVRSQIPDKSPDTSSAAGQIRVGEFRIQDLKLRLPSLEVPEGCKSARDRAMDLLARVEKEASPAVKAAAVICK